jgi:hypothetical protein
MPMPAFPSSLLALTDHQLQIVMAAAHPLMPAARDEFLQVLAARLATEVEIGEGAVARVCRDLQRSYFDPPQLAGRAGALCSSGAAKPRP